MPSNFFSSSSSASAISAMVRSGQRCLNFFAQLYEESHPVFQTGRSSIFLTVETSKSLYGKICVAESSGTFCPKPEHWRLHRNHRNQIVGLPVNSPSPCMLVKISLYLYLLFILYSFAAVIYVIFVVNIVDQSQSPWCMDAFSLRPL